MYQQTLYDLAPPKTTRFGVKRTRAGDWQIVRGNNNETKFIVNILLSGDKSKIVRVYLLALNRTQEQVTAELVVRFRSKTEAWNFMKTKIVECKTKPNPFANSSLQWEYTYFLLFNGKARFLSTVVDANGKECRKIFTRDPDAVPK